MDLSKHNRTVVAHCPTCAGTEFLDANPDGGESRLLVCQGCGRELTAEILWQENAENVAVNLEEVKAKVLRDVQQELHNTLKKAFSGSINIRFK
jgi:predicted Fe-S protein YdhL (DUF1289 family)